TFVESASLLALALIGCGGSQETGTTDAVSPCIHLDAGIPADSAAPLAVSNTNTGAMDGGLIIHGHLRDSSGTPIVGGRVDLAGQAQAVRFSYFTGGFVFHVDPGSYSLLVGGACSFSPTTA